MACLPRYVVILSLSALTVVPVLGQQFRSAAPVPVANSSPSAFRVQPAASRPAWEGSAFLQQFGIGTYESPLGFGGRVATSLTQQVVLRGGASYFSFSTSQKASDVPYTAHVVLQSEEVQADWYPWVRRRFHISPGLQFGNSSRIYGNASIPVGNSFTLNGTTYYSGAAGPVQASGSARFRRASPMLTVGWGSWVRRGEQQGHWAFPFEFGTVFNATPATVLNFTGVVCTDPGQVACENIANDPSVQANIQAERVKMHKDAQWARFYPIVAGGIVYRF
ncbi:MAG TPA: hypothetical protein VGT04_03915 [Acidobacteriaceae bacterium]|nr:hypothetical protein [Acidobacteriaceae bacterium]